MKSGVNEEIDARTKTGQGYRVYLLRLKFNQVVFIIKSISDEGKLLDYASGVC